MKRETAQKLSDAILAGMGLILVSSLGYTGWRAYEITRYGYPPDETQQEAATQKTEQKALLTVGNQQMEINCTIPTGNGEQVICRFPDTTSKTQ